MDAAKIAEKIAAFTKRADADACWAWIGPKKPCTTPGVYRAVLSADGKTEAAARILWRINFGEIPDGQWVLHRCDNAICVNPRHLYLGTMLDNIRDKIVRERGTSVLNADIVKEMIALRNAGESIPKIAAVLGVPFTSARDVFRGASWNHVTGLPHLRRYKNGNVILKSRSAVQDHVRSRSTKRIPSPSP